MLNTKLARIIRLHMSDNPLKEASNAGILLVQRIIQRLVARIFSRNVSTETSRLNIHDGPLNVNIKGRLRRVE